MRMFFNRGCGAKNEETAGVADGVRLSPLHIGSGLFSRSLPRLLPQRPPATTAHVFLGGRSNWSPPGFPSLAGSRQAATEQVANSRQERRKRNYSG